MKHKFMVILLVMAFLAVSAVVAQDGEVADPVPYPAGVPMEGGQAAQRFPLDQMVVYKALDSYSEPAWVTELVEQGLLPPVEERLPKEPQVFLVPENFNVIHLVALPADTALY